MSRLGGARYQAADPWAQDRQIVEQLFIPAQKVWSTGLAGYTAAPNLGLTANHCCCWYSFCCIAIPSTRTLRIRNLSLNPRLRHHGAVRVGFTSRDHADFPPKSGRDNQISSPE